MKFSCCFFLFSIFLLASCGSKNMNDIHSFSDIFYKSRFETLYPDYNQKELTNSLQKYYSDTSSTALIDNFYKNNQYASVWVKDTFEITKIDTLLFYLNNSTEHGLNPDIFDTHNIQSLRDSIWNGLFSGSMPEFYSALTRLEDKATHSVWLYTSGMKYGFINQKKTFANDYFISLQKPDSVFQEFVFANMGTRLVYLLSEIQPKDSIYSKMQKELQYYRAFPDSLFYTINLTKDSKNYKLKDRDSQIMPLIAKRLMMTGELPHTEFADSIYNALTPELMDAINTFRRNNSYPEDEEVGKITI